MGSRIERRPAGAAVNLQQVKDERKGQRRPVNSAFAGRRRLILLPWARNGQGNGLAAAQGQRGGRRRLTANTAQGKQGKGMAAVKSGNSALGKAAGLTAAVNSAFTGGRSLPRAKEWNGSSSAAAADMPVNPVAAHCGRSTLLPWARNGQHIGGGQLCLCRPPVNPAAHCGRPTLPRAKEWNGSSSAAAADMPVNPVAALCGRSTLLPWARQGNGGGQSGNSAAFAGRRSLPWAKEWIGSSARAAYRRRSLPWARAARRRSILVTLLPLPAGQSGNSAQGKEWQQDRRRRSTLLLPAAVLCPGQWNGGGQLCPGQRKGKEWNGSSSAAAADMPE